MFLHIIHLLANQLFYLLGELFTIFQFSYFEWELLVIRQSFYKKALLIQLVFCDWQFWDEFVPS